MGNCLFLRRGAPPSSAPTPGKSLNEYTWEEISYISSNGLAAEYGFQVGDAKAITLDGTVGSLALSNYQTNAYIIGINHNATLEGDNLIHFQLAKTALSGGVDICFVDDEYDTTGSSTAFRMKTTNTNSGGWEESFMRNTICGTDKSNISGNVMGVIPSDLLSVIKPVTKYTNNIGQSSAESAVTATTDYFFLLSLYEITGENRYINVAEINYQQQYAYYINNSVLKKRYYSISASSNYWTRSPRSSNNNTFVYIDTSGTSTSIYAHESLGFAPCFCV